MRGRGPVFRASYFHFIVRCNDLCSRPAVGKNRQQDASQAVFDLRVNAQ